MADKAEALVIILKAVSVAAAEHTVTAAAAAAAAVTQVAAAVAKITFPTPVVVEEAIKLPEW